MCKKALELADPRTFQEQTVTLYGSMMLARRHIFLEQTVILEQNLSNIFGCEYPIAHESDCVIEVSRAEG